MRVQRRFSRTTLHLLGLCTLLLGSCSPGHDIPQKTYNPELEYLKFVNGAGPVSDTRLIFLLMAEYLNTNQLEAGIEFFTTVLANHGEQMASDEKSIYLSVLGVLRASYAPRAPLFKRKGWVNKTIDMLEEARRLSNDQGYLARWATGVVYAQLPEQFGKKDAAREVLNWLLDHQDQSPSAGLLREVYFQLARLSHEEGNQPAAREYLAHSGYGSFERDITTLTPFAVTADQGHTFHPQSVREVIPGRVFALSGFEFTEYYFIVSKDGRHLISIDAGTHPDSAKAAYESLTSRYLNLPPLTTVFVTHAHWDHVGGHRYFRQLSPTPTFYARKNYREELLRSVGTTMNFRFFFGRKFTNELIIDFKPDTRIRKRTTVTVGGTRFALIPISGGETPDGMFIYLHEERVLFGGDFIMPYLGAPFVEEGNLKGLLDAIDIVESLNPEYLLHGHETLTRYFNPPAMLVKLKTRLAWLGRETVRAIRMGMSRPVIHHLNLMPPDLLRDPEIHFPYLILRENVINRIYDQTSGYWGWDGSGMDHLTEQEYGILLTRYLGASESTLVGAIEWMLQSGDYDLAVTTARWGETQFESQRLPDLKKKALIKLKEKYQFINPFKHIVYSELAGHETPQLVLAEDRRITSESTVSGQPQTSVFSAPQDGGPEQGGTAAIARGLDSERQIKVEDSLFEPSSTTAVIERGLP